MRPRIRRHPSRLPASLARLARLALLVSLAPLGCGGDRPGPEPISSPAPRPSAAQVAAPTVAPTPAPTVAPTPEPISSPSVSASASSAADTAISPRPAVTHQVVSADDADDHPRAIASAGRTARSYLIDGRYTVQEDDTLSGIALFLYGDIGRWRDLYAANRRVVTDPDKLLPGVVLLLPR